MSGHNVQISEILSHFSVGAYPQRKSRLIFWGREMNRLVIKGQTQPETSTSLMFQPLFDFCDILPQGAVPPKECWD